MEEKVQTNKLSFESSLSVPNPASTLEDLMEKEAEITKNLADLEREIFVTEGRIYIFQDISILSPGRCLPGEHSCRW